MVPVPVFGLGLATQPVTGVTVMQGTAQIRLGRGFHRPHQSYEARAVIELTAVRVRTLHQIRASSTAGKTNPDAYQTQNYTQCSLMSVQRILQNDIMTARNEAYSILDFG